jgi:hypothetical protein
MIWAVQSPAAKIFLFVPPPNHIHIPPTPSHSEGRFAIVTDVGTGCGGCGGGARRAALIGLPKNFGGTVPKPPGGFAEGFCGGRSRVVLTPRRWRQAGGSDSAGDSGKQARSLGRARRKPLKPLRAGMPGVCGVLVVTNARVYYPPRAAAGALAPGIPHALFGRKVHAQPGRYPRRGNTMA